MRNTKNKHAIYLLLFFCCIGINFSNAQSTRFSFNKYKNAQGDSLNYRLLFPDADPLRKFPLVIFLHGSGERGNDNEAQLKWGVENFATDKAMTLYPAFVIAPQCPAGQNWANLDNNNGSLTLKTAPSKQIELLFELIQQYIKNPNIDSNRIYITGLSMGGFGTYDVIERYPQLFAAAVPVCGGGDITKASSIKHIPIWIFHGADDAAVKPSNSYEMAAALTKAGAHPGLTIYPEVGHFSWLAAYSDPHMMEWLFRQHR